MLHVSSKIYLSSRLAQLSHCRFLNKFRTNVAHALPPPDFDALAAGIGTIAQASNSLGVNIVCMQNLPSLYNGARFLELQETSAQGIGQMGGCAGQLKNQSRDCPADCHLRLGWGQFHNSRIERYRAVEKCIREDLGTAVVINVGATAVTRIAVSYAQRHPHNGRKGTGIPTTYESYSGRSCTKGDREKLHLKDPLRSGHCPTRQHQHRATGR